jgi:hypothetical protein
MKRYPAFVPLTFGLLFTLALSLIPVAPALGDNLTACQGNNNPSTHLTLGGRTITPSLILQASGGQPCPAGETSLGLVSLSHTLIVSPNGTPVQNGTALLAAMTLISNSNPSVSSPWLLKLEPGSYDLINQSLTLLPYVDLEGSGEGTTFISSTIGTPGSFPPTNGTLVAAANSEVRLVTIMNAGSATNQAAVYVPAGVTNTRFSHFTATTFSSGTFHFGLYQSSGTVSITNSTLSASGSLFSALSNGLYNNGGTVNIANSTLIAAGASNGNGLFNGGTASVTNSTLSASGGPFGRGLSNNASVSVSNSSLTGSGSSGYGLDTVGGTVIVARSTLVGTGGQTYGLNNNNGVISVTNSTLSAAGSFTGYGLYTYSGTGVTVTNSTLNALDSADSSISYGFYNQGGAVAPRVSSSQLAGKSGASSGLTICPFSINFKTFAALNGSCQ